MQTVTAFPKCPNDETEHDTTSVLPTIEHRFGLEPLSSRDAAVADLFRAPVFPGNRP
jgi:hypothetical protein